jgi:hypothetical protein
MGAVTELRHPPRTTGGLPARRARNDLIVLLLVAIALFVLLVRLQAFERFYAWSRTHETWQLDEVLVAIAVLALASAFYALRRWRDLRAEIARREAAVSAARRLEGLLPICAACKRIREGGGGWVAVEEYVAARTEAAFTHGICPDCRQRLYPGLDA